MTEQEHPRFSSLKGAVDKQVKGWKERQKRDKKGWVIFSWAMVLSPSAATVTGACMSLFPSLSKTFQLSTVVFSALSLLSVNLERYYWRLYSSEALTSNKLKALEFEMDLAGSKASEASVTKWANQFQEIINEANLEWQNKREFKPSDIEQSKPIALKKEK
jgi:hypothetical protein